MAPRPVTIRTFDLDEAQADALERRRSAEPDVDRHRPLGVRGIRLGPGAARRCSHTQFRAILRAAAAGTVRILLPFVTTVRGGACGARDARRARDVVAAGRLATPRVPLGAMIEVPAAALTADLLAARPTSSRSAPTISCSTCWPPIAPTSASPGWSSPLHPALLRLLRWLPRLAARHGVPLSVCGEMASDPVAAGAARRLRRPRVQHDAGGAAGRAATLAVAEQRATLSRAARRALKQATLAPVEQYLQWTRLSCEAVDRVEHALAERSDRSWAELGSAMCRRLRVRDCARGEAVGLRAALGKTDRYVGKVIHINAGHALSLQYHNSKDETIMLWSGKLLFEIRRTAS